MKMTYALAMAAGQDAGNIHMRAGGRTEWDESDYGCAADVTAKLLEPLTFAELAESRAQYHAGQVKVAEPCANCGRPGDHYRPGGWGYFESWTCDRHTGRSACA